MIHNFLIAFLLCSWCSWAYLHVVAEKTRYDNGNDDDDDRDADAKDSRKACSQSRCVPGGAMNKTIESSRKASAAIYVLPPTSERADARMYLPSTGTTRQRESCMFSGAGACFVVAFRNFISDTGKSFDKRPTVDPRLSSACLSVSIYRIILFVVRNCLLFEWCAFQFEGSGTTTM